MPSFQHFGGSTPVFESTRFPSMSYQQYAQSDQSWILTDPALTQFQYEHDSQQKYNQNAQQEAFAFQQSITNSEYLPGFQDVISNSSVLHQQHSWSSYQDSYRSLRYNSPNGQNGGTLSASSSEYGFSPINRTSSMAINNCSQSFAFAPTPIESCLSQQSFWSNDNDYAYSLPSPPDSTTTNTQAIALRELEFSGGVDYYHSQYLPREDMIEFKTAVSVQIPEELELTDSIATLTTSSRAETILTPNSIDDESEPEEIDHDSDPDFTPKQLRTARRASQSSARNLPQSCSPRRNNSTPSHPVQDSKSRIQKPTKRSVPHGSKERRKSKTHTRPTLVKSYSSGSVSKAPKYFPCTFHVFGCQATFGNKNEWKRHVSSQHLQLGIFRCDLGECNPENVIRYGNAANHHRRRNTNTRHDLAEDEIEVTYNDFNRKDLFTQHCRRMHGPHRFATDSTSATNQLICERVRCTDNNHTSKSKNTKAVVTKEDEAAFERELEDIRRRCWQTRRKAPARSCCGFCNKVFEAEQHISLPSQSRSGNNNSGVFSFTNDDDDGGKAEEKAWEERMEHIGRHYERDNVKAQSELIDEDLEEWGLQVGILERRTDAEGNKKSWLIRCDDVASSSFPHLRNGRMMKDEESEMDGDVKGHTPRRSGLRSSNGRGIRSKTNDEDVAQIKSEQDDEDKEMEDENSEDDGQSDDDASAEDE